MSFHGFNEQTGFLTVAFKGGQLGSWPYTFLTYVFKGLIDGVYASFSKIICPVIATNSAQKLAENTIGKLLSVPIHQPIFASLSITIDRPSVDLSSIRRDLGIQAHRTEGGFDDAADSFLRSAQEIERLAGDDRLLASVAYHTSVALEVVAQIAPNQSAPFDTVSISGRGLSSAPNPSHIQRL